MDDDMQLITERIAQGLMIPPAWLDGPLNNLTSILADFEEQYKRLCAQHLMPTSYLLTGDDLMAYIYGDDEELLCEDWGQDDA